MTKFDLLKDKKGSNRHLKPNKSINEDRSAYSGSTDERPKAQIEIHNSSGKPITSNRPIVGFMKLSPVQYYPLIFAKRHQMPSS